MTENEVVTTNTPNGETTEEVVVVVPPVEDDDEPEDSEDVETLKASNQSLYEQLKKAKGFVRGADGKWVKKPAPVAPKKDAEVAPNNTLGTKDLYALMEAKVPQEDIDEVVEYAAFKKISVAEALKSSVIKTSLAEKAEQRTTAEAANVGASKRGTGKVPDDVLLAKAAKGELPENDADIERLARLRKGLK